MNDWPKLIRRHERIRAVWQRTKSLNTARRCECRMSALATQAREAFDAACVEFLARPPPPDR